MFPQTNRTTESFLYVINSSYDLDPYWTSYVAYKYFDTDENRVRHVNILSFFGVLQHGLVISLSFGTLFYCGIKTYLNIKEHVGMSTKTRSFQLQLFRALVVQTCLSMIMMYIPIGFMFSCPYFDLQLGAVTNYQTVMAQLYPGIDPFVVLLIIDSYRKTILYFFVFRSETTKNFSCLECTDLRCSIVLFFEIIFLFPRQNTITREPQHLVNLDFDEIFRIC
ncbi:hypothetical protein B9Z55_019226 [Caenorhabditis nigoni]|nr:hypothetical protein B9Z55_019226 [Caenorhabditis nigoni]